MSKVKFRVAGGRHVAYRSNMDHDSEASADGDGPAPHDEPDAWADDPLTRPWLPAAEATDALSESDRSDALERARRDVRLWGRRAIAWTLLVPLFVIIDAPLPWILFDDPRLDVLLGFALGGAVALWARWAYLIQHRNGLEGELMRLASPPDVDPPPTDDARD